MPCRWSTGARGGGKPPADDSADGPGAGGEVDRAVVRERAGGPGRRPAARHGRARSGTSRRRVPSRCRPGTASSRRRSRRSRSGRRSPRRRRRARPASVNRAAQRVGPAEVEPRGLVERERGRVEGHGGRPEVRHQLHPAGVVPDVGGDRPPGPGGAAHLGQGGRPVGHEVEDQPARRRRRTRRRPPGGPARRPARKDARGSGTWSARVLAEGVGGLDADTASAAQRSSDGLGERAGAGADVEPPGARRDGEPGEEVGRDEPAPPPDVGLVAPPAGPRVRRPCPIRSRGTSEKPSVAAPPILPAKTPWRR